MPKDRLTPYAPVDFRGVQLGKDANLPLAFFRAADRPKYRRGDAGDMQPTGENFSRLSWVELTGAQVEHNGAIYLQTKESGIYVAKDDAVVPEQREETPWGAKVLSEDSSGKAPKGGRATWIETSIFGGWLIAYEGTRPVFSTLISPGRGGPPVPGKDVVSTASTPTGFFRITGKVATANMVAPNELLHADVPWAQNFSGPHALHGAYWHDRWGELKSGGCINLSPLDGKWLYEFSEPPVPEGWHGVRWLPQQEPSTYLIVNGR
jgi:lipoprotein-anchoring transpeptidase ErfK/SrfK